MKLHYLFLFTLLGLILRAVTTTSLILLGRVVVHTASDKLAQDGGCALVVAAIELGEEELEKTQNADQLGVVALAELDERLRELREHGDVLGREVRMVVAEHVLEVLGECARRLGMVGGLMSGTRGSGVLRAGAR